MYYSMSRTASAGFQPSRVDIIEDAANEVASEGCSWLPLLCCYHDVAATVRFVGGTIEANWRSMLLNQHFRYNYKYEWPSCKR